MEAALKTCPRCGSQTQDLLAVDTAMRVALQATGMADSLSEKVCPVCYDSLSNKVSKGVKLRIEQETREKNKVMLWKSRVNLVKQARSLMAQKAYSEAAVSYEKYIRVLEIVYNLKSGELNPKIFNNSARSKELTVVTSVYWDLVRIYDSSPRYGDRMRKTAQKLAEFLPYSTIFPDVANKAESFARSAKNPQIIKDLLKQVNARRPRCFVATAIYRAPQAYEVQLLRSFRDLVLRNHPTGRWFIKKYYHFSPPLAQWLVQKPFLCWALRKVLKPLCLWVAWVSPKE